MESKTKSIMGSVATATVLVLLVLGVPVGLVALVGWPLPTVIPRPGPVLTAIEQRDVGAGFVIKAFALGAWVLWTQLTWAVGWEVVVNGRRLAQGLQGRPAPLVPRLVNDLALRLVSGAFAASVVATSTATTMALPVVPAVALEAGPADAAPAGPRVPGAGALSGSETARVPVGEVSSATAGPRWLVCDGDSLWSIAEIVFSDGARSADLLELNPGLGSARDLAPGMVLRMPVGAAVPTDRLPDDDPDRPGAGLVPIAVTDDHRPAPGELEQGELEQGELEQGELAPAEIVVERGDSLWALSHERLGQIDPEPSMAAVADHVGHVVEQNRDQIDDPDLIFPGQVLTFPGVEVAAPGGANVEGTGDGEVMADEDVGPGAGDGEVGGVDGTGADEDVAPGAGDGEVGGVDGAEVADSAPGAGDGTEGPNEVGGAARPPAGERDPGGVDLDPSSESGDVDGSTMVRIAGMGAAAALLSAGVLDLVRRRRLYRRSHRPRGRVPADPPESVEPVERALRHFADDDGRRWLAAALRSLATRPVWEGEAVAQPLVVRLDPDGVEVEFSASDMMAAPVPWVDAGDGRRWRLEDDTPLAEIPSAGDVEATPTMVTIGAGLLVNLEAFGVLRVVGAGQYPHDLLRSVVHELATSSARVDVRSTVPIEGTESYRLVRRQGPVELAVELGPWLADVEQVLHRRQSSNSYAHRITSDDDPIDPVVVVTDDAGLAMMARIGELAARRRLPLAIVVTGPEPAAGSEGSDRSLTDPTVVVGGEQAELLPLGVEFTPQTLNVEAARELGELLVHAEHAPHEPLVPTVQLSASVTDLATRRPVPRSTIEVPPAEHPGAGLDATGPPTTPETGPHHGPAAEVGLAVEEEADDELVAEAVTVALAADASSPGDGEAPAVAESHGATLAEGEPGVGDEPWEATGMGNGSEIDVPSAGEEVFAEHVGGEETEGPEEENERAPLMVRLLGEVAIPDLSTRLTSQQLSLVCYLATVGSATKGAIVDALWDGQVISHSRFLNVLAETRAKVGRSYFPDADDGRYRLQSVVTDLDVFEQGMVEAQRLGAEAARHELRRILALVGGVPFTAPGRRFWTWVGDQSHHSARVEALVADTAARSAELERSVGHLDQARWACEQGLLASPLDETLVVALTEIYLELGKPGLARRLVDGWEDRIVRLDCGEPSDEPRKRLAG